MRSPGSLTPTSTEVFLVRYVALDAARIKYRFFVTRQAATTFADKLAAVGREVAVFEQTGGWREVVAPIVLPPSSPSHRPHTTTRRSSP